MKAKLTIEELTHTDLVSLLSDATYGNYAISVELPTDNKSVALQNEIRKEYESRADTMCCEDLWAQILLRGGFIYIVDNEAEDTKNDSNWHKLYLKYIQVGLNYMFKEDMRTAVEVLSFDGHSDMYDAYNVIQYAIFGEVIYG